MMGRLKAFWWTYKLEILDEHDEKQELLEVKTPDLDDAVTFSIIHGTDKPDPRELALMQKNSLVRLAINGIRFWASIVDFDSESETIYGVVQSYLNESLSERGTLLWHNSRKFGQLKICRMPRMGTLY